MSFGVYRPVSQPRLPVLDATKFAPADPVFPVQAFFKPNQDAAYRRAEFPYTNAQPSVFELGPFAVQAAFPFPGPGVQGYYRQADYTAYGQPQAWDLAAFQQPETFPYPGATTQQFRSPDSPAPYIQPGKLSVTHYPPDPFFPPELQFKRTQAPSISDNRLYWTQQASLAVFPVPVAFPFPGLVAYSYPREDSRASYIQPRLSMLAFIPPDPVFPAPLFARKTQVLQPEVSAKLYWTQKLDASIFAPVGLFPFRGLVPQWQQSAYSVDAWAQYKQPKNLSVTHYPADPFFPTNLLLKRVPLPVVLPRGIFWTQTLAPVQQVAPPVSLTASAYIMVLGVEKRMVVLEGENRFWLLPKGASFLDFED